MGRQRWVQGFEEPGELAQYGRESCMLWGQRLVEPASLLVIVTNVNTHQLELGTSQAEVLYRMEDGKNADVLTFV